MVKLIVSIQGYSTHTTIEFSQIALSSGAELIRTDKDILNKKKTIGLVKNYKYKNYITPTIPDINAVSQWADYVAIDCRKSNVFLKELLRHAESIKTKVICDIETLNDLKNLIKIYNVEYIATTFDYNKNNKLEMLKEITAYAKKYNITVIAEGGYSDYYEIKDAEKCGIDYICIGQEISKIDKLTERYNSYLNKNECKELLIDIDNTILKYPDNVYRYLCASPDYEVIKHVNMLYKKGYKIKLYTARDYTKYDYTYNQMKGFKVLFHELIMNKPKGVYIDTDAITNIKEV